MDLFNIILGIFGILGTLFGFYSLWDAERNKKLNAFIYEVAKMNVDKDATKNELDKLNEKRQEMNDTLNIIKQQIPLEAQKAVLFDRYKILEEQLINTYNNYVDTKSRLERISKPEVLVPNSILNEIKQEIMPEYIVKQKRNKYLISLTTISFATIFLSSLPIIGYMGKYMGILAIFPLIGLFYINIPANRIDRIKYIKKLVLNTTTIILGIANIIVYMLYYQAEKYGLMGESTYLLILLFIIPAFIVLSLYIIIKTLLNKKRKGIINK